MKSVVRTFVLISMLVPSLAFGAEWTATVSVPDSCTVTDTDTVTHTYSGGYYAICALQAGLNASSISSIGFSNAFPSFGLFVESINGTTANSSSQYWAFYHNGGFASLGVSQLPVIAGDVLVFELHDFSDVYQDARLTVTIGSLIGSGSSNGQVSGGSVWYHAPFDVPKAVSYLESAQHSDGSFGSPMLTDWVAIASATGKHTALQQRLATYYATHPVISDVVTENERHAMALLALSIDPYSGTSVDYITPIVRSFDGKQIGDPSFINDDIFAVFPLLHAGYTLEDPIVASTIAFIISQQGADGSWVGSVDMTAAALQVIKLLPDTGPNRYVVSKAVGYLQGKQKGDGSFGDPYASSWMLQAIAAMNGTSSDWQQNHLTPDYYLATLQDTDGGIMASSTNDRIWATSYAIPGIRRATWDSLLKSFPKPSPVAAVATSTTSIQAEQQTQVFTTLNKPSSTQEWTSADDTSEEPIATSSAPENQAATASVATNDETFIWYIGALLTLLLALWGFAEWRRS